jgi:hypothetical protein
MKRGNNGQILDLTEARKQIPSDLSSPVSEFLDILRYDNYAAMFRNSSEDMSTHDLMKVLVKIQQQRFNLETLGNAFTPFSVTVGTTPTQILAPNKTPRGYLFLNPSQTVNGITTDTTMFASASRGAGTVTSTEVNVQAFRTSRFFLNITVSPTTLVVNIQTRDPLTLNWATAQTDIFSGVVATGAYYVDTGEVGTDDFVRIQTVSTGTGTWSIAMVSKEAYGGTVSPPGIFLGNANVTTAIGYPILGGQEKRFLLMDNTPLYGVALVATPLSIFQLQ